MSKSKKNGISPARFVQENGSDCLRLALFFYGPNEKDINWDESIVKTIVLNFLYRTKMLISNRLYRKISSIGLNQAYRMPAKSFQVYQRTILAV